MQETLSHTNNLSKDLQVECQKKSLTHRKTTIAALHGGQASRKICRGKESVKRVIKQLKCPYLRCRCREGTYCLKEFYEYNKEVGAMAKER